MTTEPVFRLKQQIDEISVFLKTTAHANEKAAVQSQIDELNDYILQTPPRDEASVADLLLAFGKRDFLFSNLNHFEDVLAALKAELLKAEETEQQR